MCNHKYNTLCKLGNIEGTILYGIFRFSNNAGNGKIVKITNNGKDHEIIAEPDSYNTTYNIDNIVSIYFRTDYIYAVTILKQGYYWFLCTNSQEPPYPTIYNVNNIVYIPHSGWATQRYQCMGLWLV